MCSILGVLGKTVAPEILQTCFARTASRGPDMNRFVEIPCGYLGFQRLAIMGLDERGMQPFLPRRRLCGLQRRIVRLPPPARAAQGEVYIRQRIRLRDFAAPLPRIRPGDVPRAGRGVRAGHLRRGEKQPRRRPRPHRHPPALLWGDRGRRHGLRQRAKGPRGAVRCDPALSARLLLGGRATSSATPTPRTSISSPWWTRIPPAPGCAKNSSPACDYTYIYYAPSAFCSRAGWIPRWCAPSPGAN